MTQLAKEIQRLLLQGQVIPASPLALDSERRFDERRQRAIWRYYSAAGAGGIAIGVHTTQFAIREPKIGLYEPLLSVAHDELDRIDEMRASPLIRVAGVCGQTSQAVREAELAREHGFHLALLSLSAMRDAGQAQVLDHCRAVSQVCPLFGFYLQPDVGGVVLPYSFWRAFCEIPDVVAIKAAPFNRYRTIDVMRAVVDSRRDDIAMYTGNDDNIVLDLVTPYRFAADGIVIEKRFVGGLLGHWACWTRQAVSLLEQCHRVVDGSAGISDELFVQNVQVTDANAALFDVANGYAGCIPGIHEVLRRQGLLDGTWCLDPSEVLGPGQGAEIDRIYQSYPHLNDDAFVAEHIDQWLKV